MTKRTRRKHGLLQRVTGDAVALYRAGDWLGLHRALGLPPWHASPLDVDQACPWPTGCAGGDTWQAAVDLRAELESA
jgi:hypothetical protein